MPRGDNVLFNMPAKLTSKVGREANSHVCDTIHEEVIAISCNFVSRFFGYVFLRPLLYSLSSYYIIIPETE